MSSLMVDCDCVLFTLENDCLINSALDAESERVVQDALDKVTKG